MLTAISLIIGAGGQSYLILHACMCSHAYVCVCVYIPWEYVVLCV